MSKSIKCVPGEGSLSPKVVFIGEAPGAEEDRLGRPFVGRSGKLLDKMIEFMGLTREEVYITNIVKVRPDNNRTPDFEEILSWKPVLAMELNGLRGEFIPLVTLGATATKAILGPNTKITQVRGDVFDYGKFQLVPTFHPAYLLRNPKEKEKVKADLLLAKGLIDAASKA